MRRTPFSIVAALVLFLVLGTSACRREQTKVQKTESKVQQLEKKLEQLRQKQQEIEQKIPDLEARLERARADVERERQRFANGTPTKRERRPSPTPHA